MDIPVQPHFAGAGWVESTGMFELAYSLMKIVAKYVNKYDMQFKVIHYNIERILQYIFKSILVMKER